MGSPIEGGDRSVVHLERPCAVAPEAHDSIWQTLTEKILTSVRKVGTVIRHFFQQDPSPLVSLPGWVFQDIAAYLSPEDQITWEKVSLTRNTTHILRGIRDGKSSKT